MAPMVTSTTSVGSVMSPLPTRSMSSAANRARGRGSPTPRWRRSASRSFTAASPGARGRSPSTTSTRPTAVSGSPLRYASATARSVPGPCMPSGPGMATTTWARRTKSSGRPVASTISASRSSCSARGSEGSTYASMVPGRWNSRKSSRATRPRRLPATEARTMAPVRPSTTVSRRRDGQRRRTPDHATVPTGPTALMMARRRAPGESWRRPGRGGADPPLRSPGGGPAAACPLLLTQPSETVAAGDTAASPYIVLHGPLRRGPRSPHRGRRRGTARDGRRSRSGRGRTS